MSGAARRGEVRIGAPSSGGGAAGRTSVADVSGRRVSFASADVAVEASPEALGSAFLLPALAGGARLRFESPPGATWLGNARRLVATWRTWWRLPETDPLEDVVPAEDRARPSEGAGQCFSGGIDSFWTLFHSPHPRDALVHVEGFDVALGDRRRRAAAERSVRAVASATGRRAVLVATDVRRHPLVRAQPWSRVHAAVLVAAGHAVASGIGTLVVPASWGYAWARPFGSHWDTDPLLSGARLRVVHDDASLERWDKAPFLLDEPLVAEHLRVCWERRDPVGNCGRCEKCLRTRLLFARWGCLGRFARAFASSRALEADLDRLARVSSFQLDEVWAPYLARWDLGPTLSGAVSRLVARSRRASSAGPVARAVRRLGAPGRRLVRWVRGRRP